MPDSASISCPHCGAANRPEATFCAKCGKRMATAPPQPASKAPAIAAPTQPAGKRAPGATAPTARSGPAAQAARPRGPLAGLVASVRGLFGGRSRGKQPAPVASPSAETVPLVRPTPPGPQPATGPAAPSSAAGAAAPAPSSSGAAAGADRPAYDAGIKPTSGKASDVGKVRTVNEDSLVAFDFTRLQESRGIPIGFYVVADGMGGHQAGEIASRTVNKVIAEKVINAQVIPGLGLATQRLDDTPDMVLKSAVKEANRTVHALAQRQGNDMGTTLTAALLIGSAVTIANVGDSRTYLLSGGKLRQVTQDHSVVASLVKAGIISAEEARSHPDRNQVYRTVGVKPDVEPDVFTETLARGDSLILCSDGLWEMVPDAEIATIVDQARTPQEACQALVRRANENGGQDNVTVIVVRME